MEIQRTQLLEQIMASMGELHRCFATTRDGFLAQFKLSRPQMEVLIALKQRPYSTGELAKEFSISSSAVSQMVDQLENKELVERRRDQQDRRKTTIQLAPQTRTVFNNVRGKFINHLGKRFTDISNAELETLLKIVTKTANRVGKDTTWKK